MVSCRLLCVGSLVCPVVVVNKGDDVDDDSYHNQTDQKCVDSIPHIFLLPLLVPLKTYGLFGGIFGL